MQYKIGDSLETTKQVIRQVIGQDGHSVVVITEDGQIRNEFPPRGGEVPSDLKPAIDTLAEISSLGRQVLRSGHRDGLRSDLAEALWAAFQCSGGDRLVPFAAIRHRLEGRWRSLATVAYFEGVIPVVLLSLIPLGITVFVTHQVIHAISIAAAGGAAGVLISVAERLPRLEVDDFSPFWHWTLEGAFRGLLGVVSGIIMVALIDFDLFFGFAKGRNEGVFLAAVVAGFAERLVPTLLIRLTHTTAAGRKNRTTAGG